MTRILPHLFLCAIVGFLGLSGHLSTLLYRVADLSFKIAPRQASGNIVIVAIDRDSLNQLGPWPWPRRHHAKLLDQLGSAGVRRVALDIDFSGRTNARDDQALAESIGRMDGRVILPVFRQTRIASDKDDAPHAKSPYAPFTLGAGLAAANVALEKDGTARRYRVLDTWNGRLIPSLAASLTGNAAGNTIGNAGPYYLDYGIQPASVPRLSYVDILNGNFHRDAFTGKTVIVGAMVASLGDQLQVPVHGSLSGPLVHAMAAESFLQGRPIYAHAALLIIVTVFLLLYLGARLFSHRLEPATSATPVT